MIRSSFFHGSIYVQVLCGLTSNALFVSLNVIVTEYVVCNTASYV